LDADLLISTAHERSFGFSYGQLQVLRRTHREPLKALLQEAEEERMELRSVSKTKTKELMAGFEKEDDSKIDESFGTALGIGTKNRSSFSLFNFLLVK